MLFILFLNRFVGRFIPPIFPAHFNFSVKGPSLQELKIDSEKEIAAANMVEDVAAADTLKEITEVCSVVVHVEWLTA